MNRRRIIHHPKQTEEQAPVDLLTPAIRAEFEEACCMLLTNMSGRSDVTAMPMILTGMRNVDGDVWEYAFVIGGFPARPSPPPSWAGYQYYLWCEGPAADGITRCSTQGMQLLRWQHCAMNGWTEVALRQIGSAPGMISDLLCVLGKRMLAGEFQAVYSRVDRSRNEAARVEMLTAQPTPILLALLEHWAGSMPSMVNPRSSTLSNWRHELLHDKWLSKKQLAAKVSAPKRKIGGGW